MNIENKRLVSMAAVITNLHVRSSSLWARAGWNGKNMFIFLVKDRPPVLIPGITEPVDHQPYVAMYTVDGTVVPWLCSQTDYLAQDWFELDQEDLVTLNKRAPRFK